MSKSLGNTVDPLKVMNVNGADVLRLWAASIDYSEDCKVDDNILKQVAETYRKIRNTFRFLLGGLRKLGEEKYDELLDTEHNLDVLDKMILNRLNEVVNTVRKSYEEYNFAAGVSAVMNFMTVDLSSFYLDIIKDSLYCDGVNSLRRRQIQTTLYTLTDKLVRLITPIIPHTADEIGAAFYDMNIVKSTVLLDFPSYSDVDENLSKEYSSLLKVRTDVLKALEENRQQGLIGSAQEARVLLSIEDEEAKKAYDKLSDYNKYMLFIVSAAEYVANNDFTKYEVCKVKVEKDEGVKCERCWNRIPSNIIIGNLCPRCKKIMDDFADEE